MKKFLNKILNKGDDDHDVKKDVKAVTNLPVTMGAVTAVGVMGSASLGAAGAMSAAGAGISMVGVAVSALITPLLDKKYQAQQKRAMDRAFREAAAAKRAQEELEAIQRGEGITNDITVKRPLRFKAGRSAGFCVA